MSRQGFKTPITFSQFLFFTNSPFDGGLFRVKRPCSYADVLVSDDGLPLAITPTISCHLSLLK